MIVSISLDNEGDESKRGVLSLEAAKDEEEGVEEEEGAVEDRVVDVISLVALCTLLTHE